MEVTIEKGRKVLTAKDGYIIQSVTDGSLVGHRLILGKKDSEIHYHEIPITTKDTEDIVE